MMDLLVELAGGFRDVFAWLPLLTIVVGVALGILFGAMPGISPSMGVALLVPFTYTMSSSLALYLLVAIYLAANYGGSITAVMLNTPGTPSAAATALDGYPLTRQGKAGYGLGFALIASVVGGLVGILMLIFFSVPLAAFAVRCHPADYFALAMFGLSTVASLGGGNRVKAFAAAVFGLLLSTIGIDPISGVSRFTMGVPELYGGFSLVAVLIGLFAVSEVFGQADVPPSPAQRAADRRERWPSLSEYWAARGYMLGGSCVGTVIGMLPGAGATIASFIAYDLAQRCSSRPEQFGKGSVEGLSAAEAADSASVGGALIPLLTLGIPGSATTAVLIGALMIHDLVPGPMLMRSNPRLVYGLFASLLVANAVLLLLGLWGSRVFIRVTAIPWQVLNPLILAASVVGSFAICYSLFDVATCLAFGALGWELRRHGYPMAPIVLGLVLGNIAETNFIRAVMMGGYATFVTRPLSAAILAVALLSLVLPLVRKPAH